MAEKITALLLVSGVAPQTSEVERNFEVFRAILGDDVDMANGKHGTYICREWSLHEDPLNEVATALWWQLHPDRRGDVPLHGPILITGPVIEEDESSVTQETQVRAAYLHKNGMPDDLRTEAVAAHARWVHDTREMYEKYGRNRKEKT